MLGKPAIRGTRSTVEILLEKIATDSIARSSQTIPG